VKSCNVLARISGKKANPGEKKGVLLGKKNKKSGGGTPSPNVCDNFLF
jgi:hypothetical protein